MSLLYLLSSSHKGKDEDLIMTCETFCDLVPAKFSTSLRIPGQDPIPVTLASRFTPTLGILNLLFFQPGMFFS